MPMYLAPVIQNHVQALQVLPPLQVLHSRHEELLGPRRRQPQTATPSGHREENGKGRRNCTPQTVVTPEIGFEAVGFQTE
jgi:hypothetical protein